MVRAKLSDIADIKINLATSKKRKIKIPVQEKELKIGMLKSRTRIDYSKIELTEMEDSQVYKVKKNDIIIKRVNPIFPTLVLEDKDLALGPNLICIRIKENYFYNECCEIYAPYLACYLDSKIKSLIRNVSMPVLMIKNLLNLDIPLDDDGYYCMEIGDAWVCNNEQYAIDQELINEKYEYFNNKILKIMEELI